MALTHSCQNNEYLYNFLENEKNCCAKLGNNILAFLVISIL